jgi:enoyl-[acyl-carrier-protein] reductase (NADH)
MNAATIAMTYQLETAKKRFKRLFSENACDTIQTVDRTSDSRG